MRFTIEFEVDNREIYKDKNKIFASWLKSSINNYDKQMYNSLYNSSPTEKEFTFSIYLGSGAIFNRESITISSDKVKMFFSCYDGKNSISFYNIFLGALNKPYYYKELTLTPRRLLVNKDIKITSSSQIFKTMSPIIIRKHHREDNSNLYLDISTQEGYTVMRENILERLKKKFPENLFDFERDLSIEVLKNKMVTVRHHNLNIPANLSLLKINSKPYIIEYLFMTGQISSLNGSGYGMLELIK